MPRLSDEQRNLLAVQVEEWHQLLTGSAICSDDTIDTGGERCYAYLTNRGFGQAVITRFKLGFDGERLTIPYLTPAGPANVKRRCITDHICKEAGHPKYMGEEGVVHLFNAPVLLTATRAVGVEGELKTIAGQMTGFDHVGIPGAQIWRSNSHWRWCFENLEEFVYVADGDDAGRGAAKAIVADLRATFPDMIVRKVFMPDGYDTDKFINEFGDIAYLEEVGLL